ncbi:transmembrane protein 87A-like [Antedon mediterranea]|uniref:transmembrane protein 87A-like n=1 Tax=Antedon mediterranea TaxID=105859 RepID=UPI003AF69CB7
MYAALEPGVLKYTVYGNEVVSISKSMYNNTKVIVTTNCQQDDCKINLKWVLRFSDCDNAFSYNINTVLLLSNPESSMLQFEEIIRFQQSIVGNETETCDHKTMFQDQSNLAEIYCLKNHEGELEFCEGIQGGNKEKKERNFKTEPPNKVTKTWQDGRYIFVFSIETDCINTVDINIEFQNEHGYLSATQRPLLTFYAVMCAACAILAVLYLVMMVYRWRDMLRVQFCICGVIILGLLEKVVFYSEYQHMNVTGFSSPGALIFAELVSCLKRTVARMLVIIISMGYGITKPYLGPQLYRVIGVGFLFFVLSLIEACLRVQGSLQQDLVAIIPPALLDSFIFSWIVKNMRNTRKILLRRNLAKFSLYRHFTNCFVFNIVASIVFMVWSMKEHKASVCVTKWKTVWLDDAFWHILFYNMLVVIIILSSNQHYAYLPLTDNLDGDDEKEDTMIPDSFEGMKMRNVKYSDSATTEVKENVTVLPAY